MSLLLHQHPARVPLTLRDFFWSDPFFSSTWNDFHQVQKNILQSCIESASKESQVKKCSCSTRKTEQEKENKEIKEPHEKQESKDTTTHQALNTYLLSDKWLMPCFLKEDFAKSNNLFQNKDKQVIRIKDEEDKLEITLDTHQFKPEEVQVNVKDGFIHVEAKHEEKSENGDKYSAQQWVRRYALPKTTSSETVVANLSSDGLLIITAPKKKETISSDQIHVPISMNQN